MKIYDVLKKINSAYRRHLVHSSEIGPLPSPHTKPMKVVTPENNNSFITIYTYQSFQIWISFLKQQNAKVLEYIKYIHAEKSVFYKLRKK